MKKHIQQMISSLEAKIKNSEGLQKRLKNPVMVSYHKGMIVASQEMLYNLKQMIEPDTREEEEESH